MAPRGRHREEQASQSYTQTQASSNGRRRRGSDTSDRGGNEDSYTQEPTNRQNIPEADVQLMVKNFVRLALACEHTRTAIRREEVSKRVFVNDHKRCFPLIFERTQERLRSTFGMELVEMPVKDRSRGMTMTQQRRVAHTQASTANAQSSSSAATAAKGSKTWILRNILPPELKQISQRQHMETDRNYNAVVMVMMIIVVMSDEQRCSESRAVSAFGRLGWSPMTPVGPFDEVLIKMTRQGYVERIKDEQSTEGAYNLYIGPRGKLETLQNREELFTIISKIYSHEDDSAAQERLARIFHDTLDAGQGTDTVMDIDGGGFEGEDELTLQQSQVNTTSDREAPRRKRSRRQAVDDEE